eukprot:4577871-Prymnesium_polylepis.1
MRGLIGSEQSYGGDEDTENKKKGQCGGGEEEEEEEVRRHRDSPHAAPWDGIPAHVEPPIHRAGGPLACRLWSGSARTCEMQMGVSGHSRRSGQLSRAPA